MSGDDNSGPLMADVARLAGVAISTVSRALANPGRVNEKTRAKIDAAAKQLGYTPNAMARGLRVGKSNVVMIVLPGSLYYGTSQVIPQVLENINRTLMQNGFNLMIANLDRDEKSERHILDLAFGGTVCGAIVLSSTLPQDGGRSLADAPIPVVALLRDLSNVGIPSVVTNDREAVREATADLIALGHRRFLYLAGPYGNYHDVERYAGAREAVLAAGLSEGAILRSGGLDYRHSFQIGVEAADFFARQRDKPTAVIATSDDMAISFMSSAQEKGYRIPDDVSIVSFDGSPVCAYCSPTLSAIQQPMEEMGKRAALMLIGYDGAVQDATQGPIVISSKLVKRKSMAPAGPSDRTA